MQPSVSTELACSPSAKSTRFSYSRDDLCQIAQDALTYAAHRGATACDVDVSEGFGQTVSIRCDELETVEYNRDKGVGITVFIGKQKGHASTSDFSTKALRSAVDAALDIARFTAGDPCNGLPDPSELARIPRDLSLYHPSDLSIEQALELARKMERAAFDHDSRITNSEGASVSVQESQFVSANSLGFMHGYPTSRHSYGCSVIAGRGNGMQRDDWYAVERAASDLPPPNQIGETAARRAVARLKSRRIKTGTFPVIFEAPLAAGLLGNLTHAISGGALYRKTSFLLDSLGKKILPEYIHILERPFLPKGLASSWFDAEGVETHDRDLVQGGFLQGYLLSSYTARKLDMQTTGNAGGSHNIILPPTTPLGLDGLIREMGRGLIVTELLGQGVNYVTGDYSRGAAGYWVENGEIAYPVEEVTIAGNLREMLMGIRAAGSDVMVRGSKRTGSIWIDSMMIAGN